MAARAVCVGETMAVLVPDRPGPLEKTGRFHRTIGGAESNVARGLAALGLRSAWISRVGDDGFGRYILGTLGAAGVDTSAVAVDPRRPTGLYVKEILAASPGAGAPRTEQHYYRTGSAASALGPQLLDDPLAGPLLAGADLIHLTGITAALSDSALALLWALLGRRRPGQRVSFDLNWRPALWRDRDPAVLRPLLDAADIVLLGGDEAARVLGTADPAALRERLPGPQTLVIKDGASCATAVAGGATVTEPALTVEVVERVGAGDAFAAGFLAGTLYGYELRRRLRLGHLIAAAALVVPGDHGTPPPLRELEVLLDSSAEEWAALTITAAGPDAMRTGGTA